MAKKLKKVEPQQVKAADIPVKARRGKSPPRVRAASVTQTDKGPLLRLEGENLCISSGHEPVAVVNDSLARVVSFGHDAIDVLVSHDVPGRPLTDVILTLDPYCIARLRIDNPETEHGPA